MTLLDEIRMVGGSVSLDGSDLVVSKDLSPALLERLKAQKSAVVAQLEDEALFGPTVPPMDDRALATITRPDGLYRRLYGYWDQFASLRSLAEEAIGILDRSLEDRRLYDLPRLWSLLGDLERGWAREAKLARDSETLTGSELHASVIDRFANGKAPTPAVAVGAGPERDDSALFG